MSHPLFTTVTYTVKSSNLKREVEFSVYIPTILQENKVLNLLLLNDGQEAAGLKLSETLENLLKNSMIDPVVVVAIKAGEDRMQEYGVAGIPDYLKRGSKAHLYSAFVVEELIPLLKKTIKHAINGKTIIAGFSMGGLSAFDIAWRNPDVFNAVGVLSGSFWWRSKDLNDGYLPSDRIMQQVVRATADKPDLKFWIMTGTEDEAEDRNQNYIIDSIDDAIDLIKDLQDKGYERPGDIFYYERVGGKHEVGTWAEVVPAFLIWAFPPKRIFEFPVTLS
jgi:enterochelin esterase-like enzyme